MVENQNHDISQVLEDENNLLRTQFREREVNDGVFQNTSKITRLILIHDSTIFFQILINNIYLVNLFEYKFQ